MGANISSGGGSSGGGGSGTLVTGATDNAVLRADGTGGSTSQGSIVIIDDSGIVSSAAYKINGSSFQIDNTQINTEFGFRLSFQNGVASAMSIVGNNTSQAFRSMFEIQSNKASNIGMIIAPYAAMTADNFQIRDSSDVVLTGFDKGGNYYSTPLASTPSTPAAGFQKLYFKNDGNLYMLDSSAAETQVNGGGAGSGATTELDNLGTTAINASLIPSAALAIDLGASGKEFSNLYVNSIYASGNCGSKMIDVENGVVSDIAGVTGLDWSGRQLFGSTGSPMLNWGNNSDTVELLVNQFVVPTTVTAGGTTGNQTINKMSGTVNFAASATSITVTNSKVNSASLVFAVVRTNDATATIKNVVPSNGSFVITLSAAATAETSVGFFIVNG